MGITAEEALGIAKKYTNETVIGGGALKGKNVVIQSIQEITGGNRITFGYTTDDGVTHTSILDVMNGEKGEQGDDGETPVLTIGEVNTVDYTEPASVTMTPTAEGAEINFDIPRGRPGSSTGVDIEVINENMIFN